MSKIYVLAPVGRTGGIEALFQLVHELRLIGRDAYLIPMKGKMNFDIASQRITTEVVDGYTNLYPEYSTAATSEVFLAAQDEIIIPEAYLRFYDRFNGLRCKKYFWWLSVDNAFRHVPGPPGEFSFFTDGSVYRYRHLYQSHYALEFLQLHGVNEAYDLKCFINEAFSAQVDETERVDRIVFNPKKDDVYWRVLAAQCRGVEFQPLQGMTKDGMRAAMHAAKIYIDFGTHPGMDRIPREAALNGLVVVTGTKGSAENFVDVPIGPAFKFRDEDVFTGRCAIMLRTFLLNSKQNVARQDFYRRWIGMQNQNFQIAVKTIWDTQAS